MVFSNQLQRNTGIVDPLIFSDEISDSWFWYHGYTTIKNHFIVRKDIDPCSQPLTLSGQETEFRIPNIADKCGPMQLRWKQQPLTDIGGTFRRFNDFHGFVAWEKIELLYSTGEIYRLFPEDCYKRFRQHKGIEERDAEAERIAGDKTVLERDALALTVQEMILDIPFPHTRGTSRWLEIMQLAHEPRVKVHWRTLENVVQTDFATVGGGGITDVKLTTTYVHLDGDERDSNTVRTESEDGIIRLFHDFKVEKKIVSAGATDARIEIKNFRTSTRSISFILRLATDVTTARGNDFFGNLLQIDDFFLEGADGKIIETVNDKYMRTYLHPLYHEGPHGDFIYAWEFGMTPDDLLNASGSYNFGNTTNATLIINFLVALGADVEVTMMADEYNTHQHVRGDLQTNFK